MMNSPRHARAHPGAEPSALAQHWHTVRSASLRLIDGLAPEDCQAQSMPDASPLKWHLAHTTWFFETFVLERFEPGFRPFDAAFRVLFNSYYQTVGPQHPRPARGLVTRPALPAVLAYRANVDERMSALLSRTDDRELQEIVTLGLHHEQQHQELMLTDLKHLLWQNPLMPAYAKRWPLVAVKPAARRWHAHAGGWVEIGHDAAQDGAFGFDNEGPRHRVHLAPFEIASHPVTYGDWLAFIDDGGYRRPELWLSMGWDWVCAGGREAPLYWFREPSAPFNRPDAPWRTFTLQGAVPIDAHTPLPHLSFFEADAYARWAGARLPSEFEWEAAARQWPARDAHYADRGAFHPLPVASRKDIGAVQLFGDVWEWTSSPYLAYPRFKTAPGAIGEYNGKFMCDQWVLRGGSCVTPAGHVRASYRNFFPATAQWQFSGVRLARDVG
jgi:ergothioneine biosynthesis protein EgtB